MIVLYIIGIFVVLTMGFLFGFTAKDVLEHKPKKKETFIGAQSHADILLTETWDNLKRED